MFQIEELEDIFLQYTEGPPNLSLKLLINNGSYYFYLNAFVDNSQIISCEDVRRQLERFHTNNYTIDNIWGPNVAGNICGSITPYLNEQPQ